MRLICERPSIGDMDWYLNTILNSRHLDVAKDTSRTYLERISAFANHYRAIEPHILEYSKQRPLGLICTYFFDYSKLFTPIEKNTWDYIRCIGYVPLYPQYPVGRFIVDFGNPYHKIALELDGADYHDKNKDVARDRELINMGWVVYRATGSESNTRRYKELYELTSTEHLDEIDYNSDTLYQQMSDWFLKTAEGLIYAIRANYFSPIEYFDNSDEVECWTSDTINTLIQRTLNNHRSF